MVVLSGGFSSRRLVRPGRLNRRRRRFGRLFTMLLMLKQEQEMLASHLSFEDSDTFILSLGVGQGDGSDFEVLLSVMHSEVVGWLWGYN